NSIATLVSRTSATTAAADHATIWWTSHESYVSASTSVSACSSAHVPVRNTAAIAGTCPKNAAPAITRYDTANMAASRRGIFCFLFCFSVCPPPPPSWSGGGECSLSMGGTSRGMQSVVERAAAATAVPDQDGGGGQAPDRH